MTETVTADDIRALRDAAGSAGDLEMVKICDRALGDNPRGIHRAWAQCQQVILDARMRAAEDKNISEER